MAIAQRKITWRVVQDNLDRPKAITSTITHPKKRYVNVCAHRDDAKGSNVMIYTETRA
jgi:hypothetical protein